MSTHETQWAHETFGHAELGDERRTRRLVKVAASVARNPGGTVTRALSVSCEREGAFRLLENRAVRPEALADAVHVAAARQCAKHQWVYVIFDQSTTAFVDPDDIRGLGRVGDGKNDRLRGLEMMNGFALEPNGTPIGLVATRWFARLGPGWVRRDGRPVEERESEMWLAALDQVRRTFTEHASATKPWCLIDAGGDFWRVFDVAREHGFDLTVRAVHNRVLEDGGPKLLDSAARARVFGRLIFRRPRSQELGRRRVRLSVRARPVTVMMADEKQARRPFELWVVRVREMGKPSRAGKPITWTLLTTRRVESLEDALDVVRGYTLRWEIEEFHRTWKDGHCQLERSQLRSRDALLKWAIILAAVASRIERLKRRSRTEGDLDATTELTREELDAAIILGGTTRWKVGADMSLFEAVELIARVGGYTGKSSGGPPGSVTIARGLERVAVAAAVLRHERGTSG
jgi:hypothetical protein